MGLHTPPVFNAVETAKAEEMLEVEVGALEGSKDSLTSIGEIAEP